jgi:hypothetical protein
MMKEAIIWQKQKQKKYTITDGLLSDARRHVINKSIIQQKSVEIELLTGSIIRSSSPSITHSPL